MAYGQFGLAQAANVSLLQGAFFCPRCRGPVSLRKGTLRIPYFAHSRSGVCSNGSGETEEHRRCKSEIYCLLRENPLASEVSLELSLGDVRADVFARISGIPVAIEVQLSTLSPQTIAKRTAAYTALGIYVLWLLPTNSRLRASRFSPLAFERWVHAAYFGRIYFWQHGLTVLPVRFTESSVRVDKYRWKTKDGQLQTGGGYSRPSRRYRKLLMGKPLHLLRDFHGIRRDPWRSKTLEIPEALLFLDKRNPFENN